MGAGRGEAGGHDFGQGVPLSDVPADGMLAGKVDKKAVLLTRFGGELKAFDAHCTHYGGPLPKGLVDGDRVHCPWHHACFSLRTGEPLGAPAFDPLGEWKVEVEGGTVFVRERLEGAEPRTAKREDRPRKIVIVGGGAAGFAAAEMLRRRGYGGSLVMLSNDEAPPCDRPNLSKDYLSGEAPEDWIPLKGGDFYAERKIDLRLQTEVASIDTAAREVVTGSGERVGYDALLLATGSEPVRLPTPGLDRPNVYTLRSVADSRRIIAAAEAAKSVAVIGASFIGLEVAASLRHRGLEVHVIAPEAVPMEKVMGREIGQLVLGLHREKGVTFHLEQTASSFDGRKLTLSGGGEVEVDFVVVGVGVRPRTALAEAAGLAMDKGVLVDDRMRTSVDGIYAAGDIARYPDHVSGERIRVEHWVAAERQGQTAALAMLGEDSPLIDPPFFWSQHYELTIRYTGHVEGIDRADVDGSVADADATVRFFKAGRLLAAASVGRDYENLEIEAALRRAEPLPA